MKAILTLLLGGTLTWAAADQIPLGSSRSADDKAPAYRPQLLALHRSLVEIPSISGNEHAVGTWLVKYLEERIFHTERQYLPLEPGSSDEEQKPRFNVLAWPRDRPDRGSNASRLLVSSHIDTVPPFIPYAASDVEPGPDTVLSGRGSVDAKGAVAAQIIAVLELLGAGAIKAEDVMLLYVVGEETAGDGMRYFNGHRDDLDRPAVFRAGIFGEPTGAKLACGHKGALGCVVSARGKAGHSGYPWLGKSATELLMRGLVNVLDADLGSSELFGNTTVNVGVLEGGAAPNVIAAAALAQLVMRIAIGPQKGAQNTVQGRIEQILGEVDDEAFEVRCTGGYGAVKCDCDVEGFEQVTVNYGTDVANLDGDHTKYLYGPGSILVAHAPNEALRVKDLERAVEDYKKLIVHALDS